ncbi:hypothetical protein [Hymenobacter sp. BT190]|uniref:hypothetical protein n=1 Tax=Hymenobacter sp. BT190 TaxID=2763505 RepID=UPI0016516AFA|nr:hypothetical protein [Hymenobacter sp. BT190]MBC6697386.1 hypothetical protein [Hymenobacter sp. BT190]
MHIKQYSSNGEDVELEVVSGELLFIDPLYWDDIRVDRQLLETLPIATGLPFVRQLNAAFFPYGGELLLGYQRVEPTEGIFRLPISHIRSYGSNDEEWEQQLLATNTTAFSLDSGGLLIIDLANFWPLLDLLDFDALDEASEGDFAAYQQHVNQTIGNCGWAYAHTPSIGNGFDFVGSGSYFLGKPDAMPTFTS